MIRAHPGRHGLLSEQHWTSNRLAKIQPKGGNTMDKLDRNQRQTLRCLFKSKTRFLPPNLLGAVMTAFDSSLQQMDRIVQLAPDERVVSRQCSQCGARTIRGWYGEGRHDWLCAECAGASNPPRKVPRALGRAPATTGKGGRS